ncbi:MAG: metal ABC transporter permease [Beijerinckiaceae bacterium]|nr:metal ABC transporter permease [Beijerinckiaceae bacterium]
MSDADWLETFLRVVTLRGGYNTIVVMIGVSLLGVAAGAIGVFALLRKRAMMSDVLSHATLPGIGLAFLVAAALGANGRSLPVLLAGATIAAIVAALTVQWLSRSARLPEDAAMGAVLSVFFGLGAVLLSYIQTLRTGAEGGLSHFILGQTAAMSEQDAFLIGAVAAGVILAIALLGKEFRIVCFDPEFGAVQGWPIARIDLMLMALVVIVAVIGLQAVGMLLIVALMIVPAAAARQLTHNLWVMVALSALMGGVSAWIGAALSATFPRAPAGGLIVLVAGGVFIVSLLVGAWREKWRRASARSHGAAA